MTIRIAPHFVLIFIVVFTPLSTELHAQVYQSDATVWAHGEPVRLFDGETFNGWRTAKGTQPEKGWEIQDGTIHRAAKGAHLFSKDEYKNFELRFDWKIAPGANSGIKYRVRKYNGQSLGCEFQMLDEKPEKQFEKGATGSLYALYAPSEAKSLRPAGEWNSTRIVVLGNIIEHWLNGRRIIQADTYSNEWHSRLAESKFSEHHDFGQPGPGRIMLQDHGGEVWFRELVLIPFERVVE